MKARKKVVKGGSSASKTYAILAVLIDMATKRPGLEISVVAESIPHIKKGALKDFIKIMIATGRWIEDNYNATDRKYTFVNRSYIEFFSPESVLGSRRNVLYINEANNILYSDYIQLAMRTSADIFIDYNPSEEFWAETEVLKEANSEQLTLTYLDNEARPANVDEDFEEFRKKSELEKAQGLPITSYWQNYYRVYVLGLTGNLQGVVFSNWTQIQEVPKEAELLAYGLDWGFTNDPSCVIAVYKHNGKLIADELIYQQGLTNADLAIEMKKAGIKTGYPIICDSSEPKSIEDLKRMGFPSAIGANKGPDSIRAGINRLQEFELLITSRSINGIKELRNYKWVIDANNKADQSKEPIGQNHFIDPLRYVALNKLSKQVARRYY